MPGYVSLEIMIEEEKAGYLIDQTIRRMDLEFISDKDGLFFRPEDDVSLNADKLVNDYDSYSIVMTTDLFHEKACQQIASEFEMHHHSV
ncbi:hypothetical protein KW866_11200 [Enterobacter quasiroggenkampii]|nr:hypothetical protein [Enterobacter quasiroggenkampii]